MTAIHNVIDLNSERRRRARAAIRAMSVEIRAAELASIMNPRCLQQIAMELEGAEHEISFTPRASLIERLRFTHGVDEFADIIRITLEKAS